MAAAHVQAFGGLEPGWTLAQAEADLRRHDTPWTIPSTLLALDCAGDWLGSISMLDEDHPQIHHYRPWLASLYVRPETRGRGIGAALLERAVTEAGQMGVRQLHLYCVGSVAQWYRSLGWQDREQLSLGPMQVQILVRNTSSARP